MIGITPKISVIIPVKNGASTLKQCLDAVFKQTVIEQTEVIIIDSGSSDESIEIIKKYNVRLYQIPSEEFNHGATRNYGVSLAKGELVYLTVQDAVASDISLLERMASHFLDTSVMAVAGRQIIPHHKDKNPHQWFRPVSNPKVEKFSYKSADDFDKLSANEKRWACGLDDVNAMYRRSALIELPFRPLQFAEDMVWAADAYRLGYTIILDHAAHVNHYHHQNYRFAYKISLLCSFAEWKYLGLNPNSQFRILDFLLIIYRNLKYKANPKWIPHQWLFMYAKHKAKIDFKNALINNKTNIKDFINQKIDSIPQGEISKYTK